MPTYDFMCPDGHRFEDTIALGDENPECVQCAAPTQKIPSFRGMIYGGDTPKFYPHNH